MAIDTEEKRASAFIDSRGILIPPGISFGAPERGWLLGEYTGVIPAGPAVVIFGRIEFTVPRDRPEFTVPNSRPDFTVSWP